MTGMKLINDFDNKKFKEIIVMLNELYDHKRERAGYPFENNGHDDASEGTISFSFSFVNSPNISWKQKDNSIFVATSVYFRTVYLPRQLEEAQIFEDMDHLYDQVKIWHRNEMSKSLDDKTPIFEWNNNALNHSHGH